jgi:hypothetical protein
VTEAERASYRRQFDQAQRRLPRGHVIHHATWRDGQLSVMSHRPERVAPVQAEAPRVHRGVQGTLL